MTDSQIALSWTELDIVRKPPGQCRTCAAGFIPKVWQVANRDFECDPCRSIRRRAWYEAHKPAPKPATPVSAYIEQRIKRDEETGCWLWTGQRDQNGYGRMRYESRLQSAHRVVWSIAYGAIKPGLCVCHRCDNPRCVNLAHLFLGTQTENLADMHRKGRASGGRLPGAMNPAARLTPEQVSAIRADRRPCRKVAAEYGVAPATVNKIHRGAAWRDTCAS